MNFFNLGVARRDIVLLFTLLELAQPLCVLESDFGFKINCAFKKSGLFRVRNLGGIKAHASLGFSLGDELGFEQSLTNMDPSRRRSVSIKNGGPPNLISDSSPRTIAKQEKRAKQNRIMMRPNNQPNQAAMDSLSNLHRRATSTMQPIIVGLTADTASILPKARPTVNQPTITIAKPMKMGVPPFKPLPPEEETLHVLPIATKKSLHQIPIPQSKGPELAYQKPQAAPNSYVDYNLKKVDDYNNIIGVNDEFNVTLSKEDINAKLAELAKAGNISMEAVEAAIALRQQQLLSKYANIAEPTTTTTTTTEPPLLFQADVEPDIVPVQKKPKRPPTTGKVMNAPREYYPVGYEKNFDDQFKSKVDLPETSFHCGDQKYFPGLYGDEHLGCMVFHVCALTDDGLVMKSFLCPESTLFDQTILKCNWWFYVDCKSTKKLYDTNIPVSKSYQLMKALTFFSSYKNDNKDSFEVSNTNPEYIDGVKEAISILENHDSQNQTRDSNAIKIITPQTFVDERNAQKNVVSSDLSPVYRGSRNRANSSGERKINKISNKSQSSEDTKSVESTENTLKSVSSAEKKLRRRPSLRNPNAYKRNSTGTITKSDARLRYTKQNHSTSKEEILVADNSEIVEFKVSNSSNKNDSSPAVASSAESKEIEIKNNEKVMIVRPTTSVKLVGGASTPAIASATLSEAIITKPFSARIKLDNSTLHQHHISPNITSKSGT